MCRQGPSDHRAARVDRAGAWRKRGPSRRRNAARARRGDRSQHLDRDRLPDRPPVRGSGHPRTPRVRRRPLALRGRVGSPSRPSDRRRDRQRHRVRRRGARSCCRSGSPRSSASASSTIAWSCTASPSTATAEAASDTSQVRAALRSVLLLLLFAVIGPIHVATKRLLRPLAVAAAIPRRRRLDCRRAAGRSTADRSGRDTLLISNHVSWLDILDSRRLDRDRLRLQGQSRPRRHPLARRPECDALRQPRATAGARRIRPSRLPKAAERDQPIALFPEGTTGPGDELLPFRSLAARSGGLRVGRRRSAAAWPSTMATRRRRSAGTARAGKDNVLRILGRQGHHAGDRAFASAARPH